MLPGYSEILMASPQELSAVRFRAEVEGPAQALFSPLCWRSAHLYHCNWGRLCHDGPGWVRRDGPGQMRCDGLGQVLAPCTSLPPEEADAAMDLLSHPGWPGYGFLPCCWYV